MSERSDDLRWLQSAVRLLNDNDFKEFLKFIQELRTEFAEEAATSHDDVDVRRAQGGYAAIGKVLELVDTDRIRRALERHSRPSGKDQTAIF